MEINIKLASFDELLTLIQGQFLAGVIQKGQDEIMKTLADLKTDILALAAKVTAENTVIDGAVTAFKGVTSSLQTVTQQLKDAIANQDPAAIDQAATDLENLTATVDQETMTLATAIATTPGTPASPPADTTTGNGSGSSGTTATDTGAGSGTTTP